MKLAKFIPLTKVEEQADGTLSVYGVVTAQEPDKDGEVCDYSTTKPYYKALNDEFSKATDGKSIAPLREMHQLSAVGCGKSINFLDADKKIEMGFKVVDLEACKKVREGVYTGFSQGGDYVKTWQQDGNTWYTAKPGEISLVDSPCLPSARFSYVKADGSEELRKFAEVEKRDFSDEQRKKLAESGAALPDGSFPIVNAEDLENAIQAIGRAKDPDKARAHIRSRAKALGLESKIPDSWKAAYRESLRKQIDELEAALKATEEKHMTPEELQKASREDLLKHVDEMQKAHVPVLDHLKNLHKAVAEHHDDMCKAHGEHMSAMHDEINKCMKAFGHEALPPHKAEAAGELTKADVDAAVKKALDAASGEKLTKADVDKAVEEALQKAREASTDPTKKVKLMLVDREGKEIKTEANTVAVNDEELSKSAGI